MGWQVTERECVEEVSCVGDSRESCKECLEPASPKDGKNSKSEVFRQCPLAVWLTELSDYERVDLEETMQLDQLMC